MMKGSEDFPFVAETVNHVFGDIWAMPGLSIRDKRLLVIGATTMLGRPDLIEVQVGGAIANDELTDEQLNEIPLLMLFYSGAGNATALHRSEEHTSELQSLMRSSYAVFCLKTKKTNKTNQTDTNER